ncbi:hypothetical protein C2869_09040 [Saccharobesus litoralis]|uniref:Uncharacterized protein n=1 Tax=Saccharobesus litoralis TaxID=2172099 RepID=A0A2S0VQS2_9ALTE|nr:hypothetical protein [Saccharobesus litoralis]AWB66566.1 hypothetical protein C2869_09040 [Saccharobesus litoralis]
MEKLALQIFALCFYLGPITYIVADRYSKGNEKNAWLIATMFFSWFAWLVYVSIVPRIKLNRHRRLVMRHKAKLNQQPSLPTEPDLHFEMVKNPSDI